MPDRLPGLLARLLPERVRRELFEPAARDIQIVYLRSASTRARLIRDLRIAALFLDCHRLAAFSIRSPAEIHPDTVGHPKEPFSMLLYNLRHAVRLIRREPGFMAAAILTLALGIGANVAVFAVLEAVMLRPLPYPDAERIVILKHRDVRTGITKEFIAMGDFVDLAARQTVLDSLNSFGGGVGTIFGLEEPVRVSALSASTGLLEMLGVTPSFGRLLRPEDSRPGAPPVAIIGHDLWRSRFGSDPRLVGRSIRLGTQSRQVVGIAPPGFRFPPNSRRDLIIPATIPLQPPAQRKSGWTLAAGRLKPGVTLAEANTHFEALSRQMEKDHPEQNQGSLYYAQPFRDSLIGDTRRPLLLMQGAVVLVLLIACVNVANLLLVRALGRRQEMAVRTALGAGRWRLAVQLMSEALVLCMLGGAAGLAIAYWGVPALLSLVPGNVQVPGLEDAGINLGVLSFAVGISLATAATFGVFSALALGRGTGAGALTSAARAGVSRTSRRTSSALVTAEIAVTVVLLISAGLILRSFARLISVDPGFEMESVLTVDVQVPADRYRDTAARKAFYDRALDALGRAPHVLAAGAAVVTPLTGNNWTIPFERSDQRVPAGQRPPDVGWQVASAGFFEALQIPLRSGRLFGDSDRPDGPPAVIISESIERRFFPGERALGRRVRLGDADAEIVGVVGDIRRAGLTDEPRADMYLPFEQAPSNEITLFLRTSLEPASAFPAVQGLLRSLEPQIAMRDARSMREIAAESLAPTRLTLWLLGIFAVVALALAGVGVYGVMAYAVRQRTREIGTRLALGATRPVIERMVLREGAAIILTGLAIGVAGGFVAVGSLQSLLYATAPGDPLTLGGVAALLVATMLLACYVPARRAAMVDPARTLAD